MSATIRSSPSRAPRTSESLQLFLLSRSISKTFQLFLLPKLIRVSAATQACSTGGRPPLPGAVGLLKIRCFGGGNPLNTFLLAASLLLPVPVPVKLRRII